MWRALRGDESCQDEGKKGVGAGHASWTFADAGLVWLGSCRPALLGSGLKWAFQKMK